ncbi:MAG: O-acetyl-ADP-ribose deacetylase [Pseudomonadota bacterium]
MAQIKIEKVDITQLMVDAIVNAANNSLQAGGGVDGAIHRAAGPELQVACNKIGSCDTGRALITEGYQLPAKYVIFTVGPVWQGGAQSESRLLASCYRNCLLLAEKNKLESIAFPAISCGVYGYPIEQAATIALQTSVLTLTECKNIKSLTFACFSDEIEAALIGAASDFRM